MKIDWQFNIAPINKDLIRKLKDLGADIPAFDEKYINSFTVHALEGSENFEAVVRLIEEAERLKQIHFMILYHVTYSEKERSAARWLHVRSVYMLYDHDENSETYESQHFNQIRVESIESYWGQTYVSKYKEYEHFVQIAPAFARWKPSWRSTRQFCTHNLSYGQDLFCSDEAKYMIETANLTGVEFHPVLWPKDRKPIHNLWQVWPQKTADFLAPGEHVECRPCKTCGEMRYIPQNGLAKVLIREDRIPKDLDFMQTPPSYGAGAGVPYYVISARAYQTLKAAKITRGLVFTPLDVM